MSNKPAKTIIAEDRFCPLLLPGSEDRALATMQDSFGTDAHSSSALALLARMLRPSELTNFLLR